MTTRILITLCAFYLFIYLLKRFTFRKVKPGNWLLFSVKPAGLVRSVSYGGRRMGRVWLRRNLFMLSEPWPVSEVEAARAEDALYHKNWRGDKPFYYGTMYPGGNEPASRDRASRGKFSQRQ